MNTMTELETLKAQLEALNTLLASAETDYQHCLARGDWDQSAVHKARVAKIRNRIGRLNQQRMALA